MSISSEHDLAPPAACPATREARRTPSRAPQAPRRVIREPVRAPSRSDTPGFAFTEDPLHGCIEMHRDLGCAPSRAPPDAGAGAGRPAQTDLDDSATFADPIASWSALDAIVSQQPLSGTRRFEDPAVPGAALRASGYLGLDEPPA